MSEVTRYFLLIFANVFQLSFLFAFFDIFLEPKFSKIKHRTFQALMLIFIVSLMLLIFATMEEHLNLVFEMIFLLVFVLTCGLVLYKDRVFSIVRPSTATITIIFMTTTVVLSSFVAGLALLMQGGDANIAALADEPQVAFFILDVLILRVPIIAAYFVLRARMKDSSAFEFLPLYYKYVVCASALVLFMVLFSLYSMFAYGEGTAYGIGLLSITIILSVIVFIIFSAVYQRIKLRGQKVKVDLIRSKNELLTQNLNDTKTLHQEHRKLVHDMKQHLNVMYSLAENEGNEKLCDYIDEIHSPLKNIVQMENTGCEFLDTILTVKKQQAHTQGMSMDIDCDIITPLNIEPVHLTSILSNLLENALEACEKVEKANERYILVSIKSQGSLLNIRIENSANDELMRSNKKMRTTKKDKVLHGVGLKSVRSSVKRYGGDIIFEQRDGVFIVSIVLCVD